MTNEQAKNIIESCDGIMWNRLTDAENEALAMAIEALEALPNTHNTLEALSCSESPNNSEQEENTCENACDFTRISEEPNNSDTISRQYAIDTINAGNLHEEIVDALLIADIQSAEPDQHWIPVKECSECLAMFSVIDNETERFNYCPNCGAKMERKKND